MPGFRTIRRPLPMERGDCFRRCVTDFDPSIASGSSRTIAFINRPTPNYGGRTADEQVFLTAPLRTSPRSGPAITFTSSIPDLDHYNGRSAAGSFPLWRDAAATTPTSRRNYSSFWRRSTRKPVTAEDFLAYLAGVAANPAYTVRFQSDLAQPGLRIPITARPKLFAQAVELGKRVIWLHTFGERFADQKADRPPGRRACRKTSAPHPQRRCHPGRCRFDARRNRLR